MLHLQITVFITLVMNNIMRKAFSDFIMFCNEAKEIAFSEFQNIGNERLVLIFSLFLIIFRKQREMMRISRYHYRKFSSFFCNFQVQRWFSFSLNELKAKKESFHVHG